MTTADEPERRDSDRFCGAKKRQSEGHCTRPAGWGTEHPGVGRCKLHGGKTPGQNRAAQVEQARRDVVLFAARRDVHPAEALLELVQWKAGEVDYWRLRVRELDEKRLTWGKTRRKVGGEDRGTTFEARPNVAYVMLRDAERDLASYAAAALKAGVDERRVRLAESQGALIVSVVAASLRGILSLVEQALGGQDEALALLRDAWPVAIAEVVPRELRAIAGNDGAEETS